MFCGNILPHLALRNDCCGSKPEFVGSFRVSTVRDRVCNILRFRVKGKVRVSGNGDALAYCHFSTQN